MSISVRCFRPSDNRAVNKIFLEGMATGPGSPCDICLQSQWTWPSSLFCYAVMVGSLSTFLLPSSSSFAKLLSGFLFLLSGAFVLLTRQMIRTGLRKNVEESLKDDMRDISQYYGLVEVNGQWQPTGASCLWVAEHNDKVVGFVALDVDEERLSKKSGELRHMAVASSHRGLGIGSALVQALIEHAQKHKPAIDHVFLYVGKYQPGAITLYSKSGFKKAGEFDIPLLRIPIYQYHYSLS